MLRMVADENFNYAIVRGLKARSENVDIVCADEVSLLATADPVILEWAADHDRIVLTHDRSTMRDFAGDRLRAGNFMPGVLLFQSDVSIGLAINELVMLAECSEHNEWNGRIVFLPL